jgi:hypothetical protein
VPEHALDGLRGLDACAAARREGFEPGLVLPGVVHHLADVLVGVVQRQARPRTVGAVLADALGQVVPLLRVGRVGEPGILEHAVALLT